MMKVIFFDKRCETYLSVENVVELRSEWSQLCRVWTLILDDGFARTYKQRWYEIHRIET